MRFLALTTKALLGTASLASAFVESQALDDAEQHTCCCCNQQKKEVTCTFSKEILACSCRDQICPEDATTVWRNLDDEARPTVPPSPPQEQPSAKPSQAEIDCCCCNIGKGAIVCEKRPEEEGCICPMVMCPPGAPTIWLEPTSAPTSDPPVPEPVKEKEERVQEA